MAGTSSQVMVIFRAVCRLHGEIPATDNPALISQVARLARIDPKPFVHATTFARGTAPVPLDMLVTAAGYVAGMEQLVGHLDAFQG
jgi:hypothetical protein